MAEDEKKKKKGNIGQTVIWILMALLIFGLGGFGVTNFSGSVRSIGSVGDKEIEVDTYARALQQELRAIEAQSGQSLSFDQAEQLGLVEATLSNVITARAFDHETERLGMSVGDDALARQLREIQAFQGVDGNFDREAYTFALERVGMSEGRFEERLREETTRTILQGAVLAGQPMPGVYADTLVNFIGQRRNVTWARLDERDLDGSIPEPSDDELTAYYEENIDRYMVPERKRITYAWLSPDMLIDGIEVDDARLAEAYEDRKAEFEKPERRLVERLILPDEDTAEQARARLDDGEADFDALVAERGLQLSDIDMGDVRQSELGAAGEPVFAAESGDVVGPVDTDLGPALFRVNGIFPANTTPYRDAVEIIRQDLLDDQARRQVEARMEPIEDLLAGGATLEELAGETEMEIGTIDWFPGLQEDIAAYDGFDDAAAALQADDYPELALLEDGGVFAMRLEDTLPEEPQPLSEIRDRVRNAWETAQTMERLRAKARDYAVKLGESATFESLGLEPQTEEGITRDGNVLGTTDAFVEQVFSMKPGEVAVTEGFGSVQIIRLEDVLLPDADDPRASQLRNGITQAAGQSVGQDIFRAVASDIRSRAGVRLDQNAINAVHANFR